MNNHLHITDPRRLRAKIKRTRFRLTDYVYWLMMLFIAIPEILEVWGIDTIYKPFRVLSILLAILSLPQILNEKAITRQFSRPLLLAVTYAFGVTIIFGLNFGIDAIPLIVTLLALFFGMYGISSRKSLIIGLYCFMFSLGLTAVNGLLTTGDVARMSGLYPNPNDLGFALCFLLLFSICGRFPMPFFARWVCSLGSVYLLVTTGSRSGIIAATGVVVSQLWRQPRLFFGIATVGVALFIGSLFVDEDFLEKYNPTFVTARLTTEKLQRDAIGRVALTKACFDTAKNYGFLGVGVGQWKRQHHTKYFRQYTREGKLIALNPHNSVIAVFTEWGLVGLICLSLVFVRLLRSCRHLEFEKDIIYGYVGASLVASAGHDLVTGSVMFWAMLGICVQLLRFQDPKKPLTTRIL